MEGVLYYYQGKLKGYKKVYALIEDECSDFALFKEVAYEDQLLRMGLSDCSDSRQTETLEKDDDFALTYSKGKMQFDEDEATTKAKSKKHKQLKRVYVLPADKNKFELQCFFKKKNKMEIRKMMFRTATKE